MPANHADTQPLSKRVGGTINLGGVMGLLTNSGVAAANTLAGLDTFIDGVNPSLHADQQRFAAPLKAALRRDQNITNDNILSLTTVAGLTALTDLGTGTRTDLLSD